MLDASRRSPSLPKAPGVGYKPQHFNDLRGAPGPVSWLEIHAENYMGDGGRPHAQLRALREDFAISEADLMTGLDILDRTLEIADREYTGS